MVGGIDWSSHDFATVFELPADYDVLDLSTGKMPVQKSEYSVGRYDEERPGVYSTELFEGTRNLHVGIDLGGPVGTPCMAFHDGEIVQYGYNPEPGDYGYVIITQHELDGVRFWALYGHLSKSSLDGIEDRLSFSAGDTIGWLGDYDENGGWPPHLHFQLSFVEPTTHDLPGVVDPREREQALSDFPDPRLVLGSLY